MTKKIRRIPFNPTSPSNPKSATVPDVNRPLNDRGPSPGGLPPAPIKSGWKLVHGAGHKFHTHS